MLAGSARTMIEGGRIRRLSTVSVTWTQGSARPSGLERLHAVVGALAAACTREEIAAIVVTEAYEALGASACVLYFAEGDGPLSLGAARGVDPDRVGLRALPLDAPLPLATAVRTGEPLWYDSAESILRDYPGLSPITIAREALQAVVAARCARGAARSAGSR
jgi:GAF domain-containing protein